ncbi:MAG: peptidase M23, partial [Ignavibacteria bacterium]
MKKILILATLSLLLLYCSDKKEDTKIEQPKINYDSYGIVVDSFQVFDKVVNRNETFSDLLLPYNLSYQEILNIASKFKDEFDFRKIKKGDKYKVYLTKDSLNALKYFIYESDPINYTLFTFDSIVTITKGAKPIIEKERIASGEIESSLYETLQEQKMSPQVALKLSEIFAWQIDFYRIMKGDAFKVIFNEKFVDGEFVGVGEIKAAWFKNMNQEYYAFHFEQNGEDDYFDEEGNSLRKAFLKAPVKFSRISSRYSLNRYHPVLHRRKAHLGTDYAAPYGTPIMATGDGVVIEARYKRNNGNYVKIRHNGTYTTQYLHMQKIKRGIRPGVKVKQGDIIGFVGST